MPQPRILAFAGSTRRDSYNKKLVNVAAGQMRAAGADVTVIDLADFPLPLFDEDLEREQGTPAVATRLKEQFLGHHGLLIASPEYNSSISAVLKNAIDWVSRSAQGESPLAAFRGKLAGLVSASPGALGGLRGLVHVRAILGNIGVTVLPDQVAVSRAFEAFDDDGQLRDEKVSARVDAVCQSLVTTLAKLRA